MNETAATNIRALGQKFGFDDVICDAAIKLYENSKWTGYPTVRAREAGCLYAAMRMDPLCPGLTLKEFARGANLTEKFIGRAYRAVMTENDARPERCSVRPNVYMDALLKKLDAPEEVKQRSLAILERLSDPESGFPMAGKDPVGMAAAIIYYAYRLSVTSSQAPTIRAIAEVAQRTESAVAGNQRLVSYFLNR